MSKTLWHTIQIKVPKEMVELTKSGKVSIKKTLTKTLNISRSQKTPAIKLIPSDVNKPHIVNDGKEWNIDVLKERMAKARAMRKKNANINVFEPEVKKMNPVLETKIIGKARELGLKKKAIKHAKNYRTYMDNLSKFRKLEQNIYDQSYNNPEKQRELINKYSDKIIELKALLDEYNPDHPIGFHEFLYEPEYTAPTGHSKRKGRTKK